jgi:hypothetical protein
MIPNSSYAYKHPDAQKNYVEVALEGQLGNQFFQIATAYAYALDHGLTLTVPDLVENPKFGIPQNAKKLFLGRINAFSPSKAPRLKWREPSFNCTPIPSETRVSLKGYFQSEKYFKHRREEVLRLFAAPNGYNQRILAKYPFLASDALVVGVQIRDYRKESPTGKHHPTIGRRFYELAVSQFPSDAIYLVSSNNIEYAKSCMDGLAEHIIYLPREDDMEELYTLALCKSFIISNSSFGWWGAWLCQNPSKVVVAPSPWFALPYDSEKMERDLYFSGCRIIDYNRY